MDFRTIVGNADSASLSLIFSEIFKELNEHHTENSILRAYI